MGVRVKMSKKLHLVESLSMPQTMYKQIKLEEAPQAVRESLQKATTGKINESTDNEKVLKEAIRMREASKDKALFDKVIAKLREEGASGSDRKLWKFPVSRYGNVNGNGRIYTRELWENVIDNQKDIYCGGLGLCDHPIEDDDPGQFKNAAIVWLDMMIDDANKLIWAIGSFVGTYGHLAQEIIEAGGRVGFSSSGFGETLLDGKTINPDTYQLERVADIVVNPSQEVFGDSSSEQSLYNPGNIEYTKQTKVSESVEPKSKILKDKNMKADAVNNKVEAAAPQTKVEEAKQLTKLEKKVIERQVEGMINDTDKTTNPAKKLAEVNELLKTVQECGDVDLITKVQEKLISTRDELYSLVESATKVQNEFGDLTEMAENTKKTIVTGKLLAGQVEDYKGLMQSLEETIQNLNKENSILKAKIAIKENKEKANTNKLNKINEQIEKDNANSNRLSRRIDFLKENAAALNKSNRKLESENGVLKTRLRHANSQIAQCNESIKTYERKLIEANNKIKQLIADKRAYSDKVARLQTKIAESESQTETVKQQFEEYREANQPKISFKPAHDDYVSKYLNLREDKGMAVENYWNDLYTQYGESIKPFERQIRGAKTYRDAFNQFMKYLPRIDESMAAAKEATIDEGITSVKEREQILEEAGMKRSTEIDDINAAELENMKKLGLN